MHSSMEPLSSNASSPCSARLGGAPEFRSVRHHELQNLLLPQREEETSHRGRFSLLDTMPLLPDFLDSRSSSPLGGKQYNRRRSRRYRDGVSSGSFDDDMLTYTPLLSPPLPHTPFDVLTNSCNACGFSPLRPLPMNESTSFISALQNINQNITRGVAVRSQTSDECVSCQTSDASFRKRYSLHSPSLHGAMQPCRCPCDPIAEVSSPCQQPLPISASSSLPTAASRVAVATRRAASVITEVAHTTLGGHRKSQEDAVCIHEQVPFPEKCTVLEGVPPTYSMYGVFDGHNGDSMANMASLCYLEHLNEALNRASSLSSSPTLVLSSSRVDKDDVVGETAPPEVLPQQRFLSSALVQALIHLDRTLYDTTPESQRGRVGTTANVVAFYQGVPTTTDGAAPFYLSIANLGDSRSVLARISDGSVLLSTVDHRVPSFPTEKTRVEQSGGFIECDRVDGALEVTRSLGDFLYKLPPERWQTQSDVDDAIPHVDTTAPLQDTSCGACSSSGAVNLPLSFSSSTMSRNITDAEAFFVSSRVGSLSDVLREESGKCVTSNIVSNVADVYEAELTGDEFLVLATDGLWDCMTTSDVVEFVRARLLQMGFAGDHNNGSNNADLSVPFLVRSCATVKSFSGSDLRSVIGSPRNVEQTPPPAVHRLPTWSGDLISDLVVPQFPGSISGAVDGAVDADSECDNAQERFDTPPPPCGAGRGKRRSSAADPPSFCTTPRRLLQDVTNSLADHVVHHLHGADNVTIILLVFHSGR
ncbi:hypothetical protein DQ04_01581070 [Trypanosoma grayi]|uniref:hypothetical protein n=1 Tax=Trypanosoma grayi TaxID=71804 RepID=UPI0004F479DF|nr:hypothetical protein DQ04_01581070 [Trypanosoma grayi]KEG12610.1 hypothetical protein DQ04_01581070 [Trypanosoma grayi]